MFLSSSGGTGKSYLVEVIHNVISKYHCKDPEKLRALLLGATWISAVNKGGINIHSGLGIKSFLLTFLIIDEFSTVSCDLWTDIDSRLRETSVMIPEKTFSGLSVMTVADLLQQPPVRGKLIFYNFLIRILWNIRIAVMTFKHAELTEVELTNR